MLMLAKVGLYERDIFVSGEWRSSHAASFISGCTAMKPAPGTTQSTPPRNIFMWQAIQLAASNKQRPFAAVIADRETGLVAASGTNRVQDHPLWHAEIDAINQLACSSFVITDTPSLYTTAEPCPMCFSAILWTGITEVVFGTSISRLTDFGWRQIPIEADEINSRASVLQCDVFGGVLQQETDLLFAAGPNSVVR